MSIDIDYEELISESVDEEYLENLDSRSWDIAVEYVKQNGSPHMAVGVALYESSNYQNNLDQIAAKLDVTEGGLYNARDKLGLETEEPRGRHVQD
jgi:hypothetical protein